MSKLIHHKIINKRTFWALTATLCLLIIAYVIFQVWLNQRAERGVAGIVAQFSSLADIRYGSVSANYFTDTIKVNDIEIVPFDVRYTPFTIHKLAVKAVSDDENYRVTALKFNVKGLQFARPTHGYSFWQQVFARLPNPIVAMDVSADYRFQPKTRDMQLFIYANLVDQGQMEINLQSVNFDPDLSVIHALRHLQLKNMSLIYRDQALFNKILDILAINQGLTTTEYRTTIMNDLSQSAAHEQNEKIKHSMQELVKFVQNPQYLRVHLALNPAAPIDTIMLMTDKEAKQRLDLSIQSA